jgi:predicted acetyltransferase
MSRFQVRPYTDADFDGFARVRSFVYRGGGEVRPDERLLRDDCKGYVIEDRGRIVGAATLLEMTCSLNGQLLRCAGIGSVGVLPEERQSGAGTALMAEIVKIAAADGYAFTSLYPFRSTWYARVGYATCGWRMRFNSPTHRLPKLRDCLPVRAMDPFDPAGLKEIEAAMASRYCGYSTRLPDQWWRSLGGDRPYTVYLAGDPAEAYCALRLPDDFWSTVQIPEFAWATTLGYEAIINHFARLTMNQNGISWTEPSNSPFVSRFIDQGVEATLSNFIQYRALDVPLIQQVLGTDIAVSDALIPSNNVGTGDRVDVSEFTRAALGHKTENLPALTGQTCYCADLF